MTSIVEIIVDPGSPGILRLEKLEKRLKDTDGLLAEIGDALLQTTKDRFESQTDPDGAKWSPLKPATVAKRGSATPILTVTGRLKGSLNYDVDSGALQLGPNTVDAAVHQFGHQFKTFYVTARPYVGFGQADRTVTEETVQDWLALDG